MLGKAQKTIAADIGVKQETISKWELEKMPIPPLRIDALAQALECDPCGLPASFPGSFNR